MKQAFRCVFVLAVVACGLTPGARADVMTFLENPAQNQTVSGIGVISGWAFSTVAGAQVTVRLRIDGQDVSDIPCCVERADVAQQFPTVPQALNSGFGQVFNFNLLPGDSHTVAVEVQDNMGSPPRVEEHQVTVVRPGGFEFLSQLNLLFADAPRLEDQEILLEGVEAIEKGSSNQQDVTIRLAWQQNTQSLAIVRSENTGESTTSQSVPGGERARAQTADDTSAIQMMLENPPALTTVSGIGVVSGWAFPTTPGATITSVRLRVDGNPSVSLPCCSERADVSQAFPEQPQALLSGFGAVANFNLLTSGSHTIGVEVQDSTGASQIVDQQVTVVKLGNSEFLDQFDLSEAEVSLQGVALVLDNVKVRDKTSQEIREIDAGYIWRESCQCFVAQASCGNGNVEPGEECDGTALDGETCTSLGFSGGTLGCTETCSFETTQCTGGPRVYVTNVLSNTVSVVSTADSTVAATIPVGEEPRGIALSPDGASAYVANFKDNTVSVIDTATDTVATTVSVGRNPQGVVFAPDGTKVYVVNGGDNAVSVVNSVTRAVEATASVGREPQAIAVTPDGTRAYVTNFADDSVSVLDLNTNGLVTTIAVEKGPDGIAVTPDGSKVYVVNFNDDSVSVIDTTTNAVTGTLEVGILPAKVAFSPDGIRAFVTNTLDFTISVIDTVTLNVLNSVFVGSDPFNEVLNEPDGVAVTPNGKRVYVAIFGRNGAGDVLQAVSSATNGIVASVLVGKGPFAVAVTPARP